MAPFLNWRSRGGFLHKEPTTPPAPLRWLRNISLVAATPPWKGGECAHDSNSLTPSKPTSGSREIIGHESHGHGAFAHGGCHAVHRAGAHVASGKYSGDTRFQQHGFAHFFPCLGKGVGGSRIASGEHKTFAIPKNGRRKPITVRTCADKDEQRVDIFDNNGVIFERPQPNTFEASFPLTTLQNSTRPYSNIRYCGELTEQVVRHGLGEAIPAHNEIDLTGEP